MRDATAVVEEKAKRKTPVDRDRLRSRWKSRIEGMGTGIRGIVGNNVFYAPYVEFGTRPHWPPPGALAVWARRHKIPEFLVARAIAARGNKAVGMLSGALKESTSRIERFFNEAIDRVLEAL